MTKKPSLIPSAAVCRAYQRRVERDAEREAKYNALLLRFRCGITDGLLRDIAMLVKEDWAAELKAARKAGNQRKIKRAKKHLASLEASGR